MNQRKLIEWLNLYIDGEIEADDLERLERLVNSSPEARRIYQQYCRLDQATRMLHQRFRQVGPPEPFPLSVNRGFSGSNATRRIRRLTVMAGGLAAAIALVSGSLIVFGPTNSESSVLDSIASTPAKPDKADSTYVAITPSVIQSFNSDTAIFNLEPAGDGTLVPAAWRPNLEIPSVSLGKEEPPQAWPVYGGIQWNAPVGIGDGLEMTGSREQRIYRGPERRPGSPYQTVSFQFQK
ncbi:MAG: hypothetical protein R3F07_12625 [Opitutaceae bacterium]